MRPNRQRRSHVTGVAHLLVRLATLAGLGAVARPPYSASENEPPVLLVEYERWLNDDELAARLAGLLWQAEPDAALRELAARRLLHRPETLRAETARLLADPRSRNFVNAFLTHWLELGTAQPASAAAERVAESSIALDQARAFFAALLRENRSVGALLDASPPLLRRRLAAHVVQPPGAPPEPLPVARSLARSLITLARGTPLRDTDALAVEDILARSKVDGYRLGTLVHEVVQNELFQTK